MFRPRWWLFQLILALLKPIDARRSPISSDFDALVHTNDILADCLPNVKNVRYLSDSSGAVIFYLNETERQEQTKSQDFLCHYELEAPKNHGFHIYFDQMDFLESSKGLCEDFIQFGR